jgi:hypothetical protein
MGDPYYQTYERLKKHAKDGVIGYLEGLELLIDRPFINRHGMSGPELFEKLEMLGKINIHGKYIFIN